MGVHASSGCVIRYGAARVRTIAGCKRMQVNLARREDRLFYSKHIISKSTLVVVQTLAFLPCNAAVLACRTRCVSRYERSGRRAEQRRSSCDEGLLRYRGVGIRGVVATMAVNVTLLARQRPARRIDGTCNDQREPQETSGYSEQSCKNGTRACLRVAGGVRSDAVRRARSDRARETHQQRAKKLALRTTRVASHRVVGITLWYAFNVGYNVYNKKLSNALDYPMLIALTSLGVGILYFAPLWALGLR